MASCPNDVNVPCRLWVGYDVAGGSDRRTSEVVGRCQVMVLSPVARADGRQVSGASG